MSKNAVVALIAGSTVALAALTSCGEAEGTKGVATQVTAVQAPAPPPPPSASASVPPGAPRPPGAPPAKRKPKKPSDEDKKLQGKLDKLVKKNPMKFDKTGNLDDGSLQTVSDIARAMSSSKAQLQVITTAKAKSSAAAHKKSVARLKAIVDELKADGLDEGRIQGDAAGKAKKHDSPVEFRIG